MKFFLRSGTNCMRVANLVNYNLLGKQRSYVRPLVLKAMFCSKPSGGDSDHGPENKPHDPENKPHDTENKPHEPENKPYDPENKHHHPENKPPTKSPMTKKQNVGGPKIEMRIMQASYHNLSYDENNMRLGRILSPHLGIYKKQLTSVMSILLRMSGFVLAMGVWAIGMTALFSDLDINAMAEKIEKCDCSKNLFCALKVCLMLPFSYHAVAGTRHLLWYLNIFLSKPQIYATGYVAILLTLVLTAVLAGVELTNEKKDEPAKEE